MTNQKTERLARNDEPYTISLSIKSAMLYVWHNKRNTLFGIIATVLKITQLI